MLNFFGFWQRYVMHSEGIDGKEIKAICSVCYEIEWKFLSLLLWYVLHNSGKYASHYLWNFTVSYVVLNTLVSSQFRKKSKYIFREVSIVFYHKQSMKLMLACHECLPNVSHTVPKNWKKFWYKIVNSFYFFWLNLHWRWKTWFQTVANGGPIVFN
jgi:hypothetical protein